LDTKNALTPSARRVYLRDIAEHAGVSISTVSRVLNNTGGISESVQQHVLGVADELGYERTDNNRPELKNVMLLSKLYLTSTVDPFHADILNHAEIACSEAGIHFSYATLSNDDTNEEKLFARLQRNQVDGLLLLAIDDPDLLEQLQSLNIPIVMINTDSPESRLDAFLPDNYQGARLAMRHLIENGHERILHITESKRRTIQHRTEAYHAALAKAGIPIDLDLIIETDINAEETYRVLVKRFAQKNLDFTAVFCANDLSAMGAIRAAQENGLQIPEQISIIGFDDIATSAFLSPPLTTIRINTRELTSLALRRLAERTIKPDMTPIRVSLACDLVIRRSVALLKP
jgi:DNA-binding LacI/PurR family transcriptional regulator